MTGHDLASGFLSANGRDGLLIGTATLAVFGLLVLMWVGRRLYRTCAAMEHYAKTTDEYKNLTTLYADMFQRGHKGIKEDIEIASRQLTEEVRTAKTTDPGSWRQRAVVSDSNEIRKFDRPDVEPEPPVS